MVVSCYTLIIMRKLIINILRLRAMAVLNKFNPEIVAITGSMGKTSSRQAISLALSVKYDVRTAKKNFNNEIGVPLTILGFDSPGRNIFGWLLLFWKSYFIKKYPEILVLEYGADRPGDIDALCNLAQPNVSVLTGISPVHVEFFGDISNLIDEKLSIIKNIKKSGLVVVNGDDRNVIENIHTENEVKTFGTGNVDIKATNITITTRFDDKFTPDEIFVKTQAKIGLKDVVINDLELQNNIGYAPVMASLSALAVADYYGIHFDDAIKKLNSEFRAISGRLNPIAGIKGSLIIDDSYNASPSAMQNGLNVLKSFVPYQQGDRRIAVLGRMGELGKYNEQEHRLIGLTVAECADLFVAVGNEMKIAMKSAVEAGMDDSQIHWFETSEEAGRYMDGEIKTGDIVYVKGSQSARMERVVKDIMAEPGLASRLLVRQDVKWLQN